MRFVQFIFSAILVQPSDSVDLLQSAVSLRYELGQRNQNHRDVLDSAGLDRFFLIDCRFFADYCGWLAAVRTKGVLKHVLERDGSRAVKGSQ